MHRRLFEKQDDQGHKRSARTAKQMRQKQHRVERRAARVDPEIQPAYNRYQGWVT